MYYGIVYKVTCSQTNKSYIGRTKKPLRLRWHNHCQSYSGCPYLKRAIEKYGRDSFTVESIASAWDAKSLKEVEQLLITQENTLAPNGYNLVNNGNGGGEISEATRGRLSGRHHSEEEKQRRIRGVKKWHQEHRGITHPGTGETLTLTDWAQRVGVSRGVLRKRIDEWGIEKALTLPTTKDRGFRYVKPSLGRRIVHPETGEVNSLEGWAAQIGITAGALAWRLKKNWTVLEALTIPLYGVRHK